MRGRKSLQLNGCVLTAQEHDIELLNVEAHLGASGASKSTIHQYV
jgi:hypothetical protein